jgi:hypothetical protein
MNQGPGGLDLLLLQTLFFVCLYYTGLAGALWQVLKIFKGASLLGISIFW